MFPSPTFSRSLREIYELSASPRKHRLILDRAISKLSRNNRILPVSRTIIPLTSSISERLKQEDTLNYHTPMFTDQDVAGANAFKES